MTLQGIREYFQAVIRRYHRSSKEQKGAILSEFCATTGLNRSYVIQLFNAGYRQQRKKPGRRSEYDTASLNRDVKLQATHFEPSLILVGGSPIGSPLQLSYLQKSD